MQKSKSHIKAHRVSFLAFLEFFAVVIVFVAFLSTVAIIIYRSIRSANEFSDACDCLQNIKNAQWYYWASNYIEAINDYNQNSSTLEIFALIYTFISTGIVGIGFMILKKFHNHEKKIKKKIDSLANQEKESLMKISENQSVINDLLLARQQLWALDMASVAKDISELSIIFPRFLVVTSAIREYIYQIKTLNEIQGDVILELLEEVIQHLHTILTADKYKEIEKKEGISLKKKIDSSINSYEQIKSAVYTLLKRNS